MKVRIFACRMPSKAEQMLTWRMHLHSLYKVFLKGLSEIILVTLVALAACGKKGGANKMGTFHQHLLEDGFS